MKTSKWLNGLFLAGIVLLGTGCGKESPVPGTESEAGEQTLQMNLQGNVIPFDGQTKADGEFTFSSENILFLRLTSGDRTLQGRARYQTYDDGDKWFFTCTSGTVDGLTTGTVEACLFEKNYSLEQGSSSKKGSSGTTTFVRTSYRTPVYRAVDGSFTMEGTTLTVNINLSPATGRINFTADIDEGYIKEIRNVGGISYFTAFDTEAFEFTTSSAPFYYGSMDSRDYAYGWCTAPVDPALWYYNDSNWIHVRHYPESFLQTGQSWDIWVPEGDEAYPGWKRFQKTPRFYASYAWIYFRFVGAGGFLMGGDDAAPAHPAGISEGYYIMDREVTRGLWRYATDDTDYGWDDIAVTGKTYDEIQAFIRKLNQKTGLTFRLPTEAEWEFAAKGGFWSKGYRYSGSDDWSNVAFTYTDDGTYNDDNPFQYWCRQKSSNEISAQDMSGNVAELCSDWYSDYPEGPVQDYAGAESGLFRVVRGGSAYSNPDMFTCTRRASEADYPADQIGFRLVMEAPLFNN